MLDLLGLRLELRDHGAQARAIKPVNDCPDVLALRASQHLGHKTVVPRQEEGAQTGRFAEGAMRTCLCSASHDHVRELNIGRVVDHREPVTSAPRGAG